MFYKIFQRANYQLNCNGLKSNILLTKETDTTLALTHNE